MTRLNRVMVGAETPIQPTSSSMGFSTKPVGLSRIACAIFPCERDSSVW